MKKLLMILVLISISFQAIAYDSYGSQRSAEQAQASERSQSSYK